MPTTAQLQTAATMYAQGKSIRTVAAEIGVSIGTAHNLKHREEIQTLIRNVQFDLIRANLAQAAQNQTDKIQAGKIITQKVVNGEELSGGSVKMMELAHHAEVKVLESTGIYPSHAQSISLTQIMIDARSELSPTVERLLVGHLQGGVIDVDGPDRVTIGPKAGDKA